MRNPACRTMLMWTLVFCGLAGRAWSQSDSTALGDVARHKAAKKARFVFTDDNLPFPRTPPAAANSSSDKAKDSEKDSSVDANEKNTPAAAETTKAAPADELRSTRRQLQDLLAQERFLTAQISDLRQQVSDAPADSRRDVLNEVLESRTSELDSVHRKISAAQAHLLDLLGKQDDQAKPVSAGADATPTKADASTNANAEAKPSGETQSAESTSEQNAQ